MAFRFIHTGDWHFGKPFGRFDDDTGAVLRQARGDIASRVAEAARSRDIRHVLVAGDVFDAPGLSDDAIRRLLARLRQAGDIVWHLLPGNHDPARDDGIWSRLAGLGLPDNVRLHLAPETAQLEPGVELLPSPCTSHRGGGDPTAWMDRAPRTAGAIRIGLAHGSTQGFGGSEPDAGALIDPGRRASAGLDYLALGDWHGAREIAPGVWYAGTPEPEQFQENDPGYVLAVKIDHAGAIPQVEKVATAQFRWYRRGFSVGAGGHDTAKTVEAALRALDDDPERCLVRVELTGDVTAAEDAALHQVIEDYGSGVRHLRLRTGSLNVHLETAAEAVRDRDVARLAEALAAEAQSADPATAAVARTALEKLLQYDRIVPGDAA